MYTKGMIENARILHMRFPDARIQIYAADDVPTDILQHLSDMPRVKIQREANKRGILNMFDRFKAIDDPDCSIMFVRDADSRPHDRDIACIEDFLQSKKSLHIIRDHLYHGPIAIPGGLWGIRKSGLREPMRVTLAKWLRSTTRLVKKGDDQTFLRDRIYPLLKSNAMIHDRIRRLKGEIYTPFRVDIQGRLFCGQVHRYDASGVEYTEFDPYSRDVTQPLLGLPPDDQCWSL